MVSKEDEGSLLLSDIDPMLILFFMALVRWFYSDIDNVVQYPRSMDRGLLRGTGNPTVV
jgi:hypothetical protein